MSTAKEAKGTKRIVIAPPNIQSAPIWIIGTSPLVVHKFSDKARNMIREKQAAGSTANSKRKREAKDFDEVYQGARHISFEGWDGFAASGIRNACISACRLCNYKMTIAKLSIFVEADGYDAGDGTALVRILGGAPRPSEGMVRLATGVCDIAVRPQWIEWGACLKISWDADQFTANDVYNLIHRAGVQVGICEGRNDSKNSNGCGWGSFRISSEEEVMALVKKAEAQK